MKRRRRRRRWFFGIILINREISNIKDFVLSLTKKKKKKKFKKSTLDCNFTLFFCL